MKRADVVQVDVLKTEIADTMRQFSRRIQAAIGELVYGIDIVIEAYNGLEGRHNALAGEHNALQDDHNALKGEHQALAAKLATAEARIEGELAIIKAALNQRP